MADLETIAVTCASVISFYYGLLGLTIICTSDCSGASQEEGGEAVQLSPLTATLYCAMALSTGWVLWMLRGVMSHAKVSASLKTFAAVSGHATSQGAAWNALAMRYAIISFCLFGVVVGWTRLKLIGPLRSCVDLPPSQVGSFLWAIRSFLEGLEWIVVVVLLLFLLGFIFAASERNKFEQAAKNLGYGAQPGTGIGQATNSLFGGSTPTYDAATQGGGYAGAGYGGGGYAGGGYGGGPVPLEHLRALGKHPDLQVQEALERQARLLKEEHAREVAHLVGYARAPGGGVSPLAGPGGVTPLPVTASWHHPGSVHGAQPASSPGQHQVGASTWHSVVQPGVV